MSARVSSCAQAMFAGMGRAKLPMRSIAAVVVSDTPPSVWTGLARQGQPGAHVGVRRRHALVCLAEPVSATNRRAAPRRI